jgi:hypothetical protein
LAAAVFAGAAILAGCAADAPAAPPSSPAAVGDSQAAPGPPERPNTAPASGEPAEIAQAGLDSGQVGDFQRQLLQGYLETGDISEADWKQANADNVACMAALGHETTTVYDGAVATESMTGTGATRDEAIQRAADSEACATEHSRYVNQVYAASRGQSTGAQSGDADDAIRQCYIAKGIIGEDTTPSQWQLNLDHYLGIAETDPEADACLTAGAVITEG